VIDLVSYDTTRLLEKALPVVEKSHRVLANNLANANTPQFVPTHVAFRESLEQALSEPEPTFQLKVTHSRHISIEAPHPPNMVLERDTLEPGRNDESKFDVDKEMVELLKNSGKFTILSSILTKRYQQMREVLRIT